jgi:hypothetical protein
MTKSYDEKASSLVLPNLPNAREVAEVPHNCHPDPRYRNLKRDYAFYRSLEVGVGKL